MVFTRPVHVNVTEDGLVRNVTCRLVTVLVSIVPSMAPVLMDSVCVQLVTVEQTVQRVRSISIRNILCAA